ncbi:hypothetical protein M426DRAFT_27227 [Hypoxylon sp. CI-4A]|nr:hypothetical protein M426DRAFT_27227 [Hypoxylon sp. CI-4A]
MAPYKPQPKSGKAAPGHAKKQPSTVTASSRPIVLPAIPLPMIPKHANKSINKHTQTASTNGSPASSLEAALAGHGDHGPASHSAKPLQPTTTSGNEVNGSSVEKPGHATSTPKATNGTLNGDNHKKGPGASMPPNGVNGTKIVSPVAGAESGLGSRSALVSAPAAASANGHSHDQGAHDAVRHPTSQPQSATSPTASSDQLPPIHYPQHHPPTHLLQRQVPNDHLPEPANLHGPPHMHHYQHHPRMSNGGGVVFGGFAGSHTPSPVPLSGGLIPPPPPPMAVNGENHIHPRPNGHHVQPGGNGFPGPINTQIRPDIMPASSHEMVLAPAPLDPYDPFSPSLVRFGLDTPHSFHGSHASGEPNGIETGVMPPYPPNGLPYGGHAPHDHSVGPPHLGGQFPPFMHPANFGRHPNMMDEGLRESIAYFQDQFDSKELTDCVLELVSTKGLHHPIKITGHKLILARSPALKHHIMAARATDMGTQTITIESDDQYLRSDAWWSAVRRLYLFPLLTPPTMSDGLDFAGDKIDRFQFCLGYATAGYLLTMPDVFMRGLQMAADFITWHTVEEALGFVFEGTIQRHVNYDSDQDVELDFTYGPETRLLLDATMNFLINAFPPNFEFDPTVADPAKLVRIPISAALGPLPTNNVAPTIARGSNNRNHAKSTRLNSIKFGDLPAAYPDDGTAPPRGPAPCSPILSRILLNLPFNELRAVLTSESDGISGWNTAQERYHAVADVVAEREARRLRAVDAIRAGAVPNFQAIEQRLSAQRRHAIVEQWDVLNWQEEVIPPRGAEVPRIIRRWIPQFPPISEVPQPQLQQLQPPLYDARDSMV